MENTLENKAKFFAQHLKQKVVMKPDWEHFNDRSPMELDPTYLITGNNVLTAGYLSLTSLSQITDEDASYFSKIMHWGKSPTSVKHTIVLLNDNMFPGIAIDFLRSKGYAVSWNGLQVKMQIEYGWVKLEVKSDV